MPLSVPTRTCCALLVVLFTGFHASPEAQSTTDGLAALRVEPPRFAEAQRLFYNARYQAAAALALEHRTTEDADLASYELRSSAILFQLKALLEGPNGRDESRKATDKKEALRTCAPCAALIEAFSDDVRRGQALARTMLLANPADETALFFLGKLDLNYVWLQLGPLGKRTGWDEYWEARHSLDAVLKANPRHVRAIVARAWIDYIVDTKMPWGTQWLLGGGSTKRALVAVRQAIAIDADFFSHTEADFALWNMLIREKQTTQAVEVAHRLALSFPANLEVAAYLQARDVTARR
jgi:hypothetical protein